MSLLSRHWRGTRVPFVARWSGERHLVVARAIERRPLGEGERPIQSLKYGEAPFYCCLPCIQRTEALIAAHHRA